MVRWAYFFVILTVAALAIAGALWMTRGPDLAPVATRPGLPPAPMGTPAAPDLAGLDPEIVEQIHEALEAVNAAGHDADRWRALAVAYDANGIDQPAAACYTRAVELRPADERCWYDLAVVRAGLGDLDGAVAAMRRAIALDGDYAPGHWRLGFWLLDRGELEGAASAFGRATSADGNDEAGWIGLARVALQRGRSRDAIDALDRVAGSGSPNQAYAQSLLARAYRGLGRLEEAEAAALRGLGAELRVGDPRRDEIDGQRSGLTWRIREARSLSARGRHDEAIAVMERLQKAHPDEVAILTALATSYNAAGRRDQGVRTLERVVALRPSYYPAHLALARVHAAGDRRRALEHVDRALSLNPTLAPAHGLRGELLLAGGDPAGAATAFGAASRSEPANSRWLSRAAAAHEQAGQWNAAAEALAVLVRRDPDSAPAHRHLGVARMNLGDLDAAEAALLRAAELDPTDPALDHALRELRRRRGAS